MAKRGRPRHPDILTPREWEVLALVREGLSNEQIAERLGITERTARFHVSEILSKLGVSTRQEAAAWQPEERAPWWVVAMGPFLSIKKGWITATLLAGLAIGAGAAVTLVVWGIARTDTLQLDWQQEYLHVTVPASPVCGDKATASAFGVPRMLEDSLAGGSWLGLEGGPYQYAPDQIRMMTWQVSPTGWELSMRPDLYRGRGHTSPLHGVQASEFFMRRLDKPDMLFRYGSELCRQADGSPAGPAVLGAHPTEMMTLPKELPKVIEDRHGSYISAHQAVDIGVRQDQPGTQGVFAELGVVADFMGRAYTFGVPVQPGAMWLVLVALGDSGGPHRPGHDIAREYMIDATTGQMITSGGCCIGITYSQ